MELEDNENTLIPPAGNFSSTLDDSNKDLQHVLECSSVPASSIAEPRTQPLTETTSGVQSKEACEAKIEIPDNLKTILADDWYAIKHNSKFEEIPARLTVQHITQQYLEDKEWSMSTDVSYRVTIMGIIEYFNVLLRSQLLYKSERAQYASIIKMHPTAPPSALYGSVHLLRLIVRLNELLSSSLSIQSLQTHLPHINDFVQYLSNNSYEYFKEH